MEIGKSCTPDLLTSMDKVMADNQGVLGNIMKMYSTAIRNPDVLQI